LVKKHIPLPDCKVKRLIFVCSTMNSANAQSHPCDLRLSNVKLWSERGTCYAPGMVRGSPNPKHFGLPLRLRRSRVQSGLTKMALSAAAAVGSPTVLYTETGQRIPSVGTIAKLAAALGVSAPWLAYGLGDATPAPGASCDGMGQRLQAVRTERGLTKAALARLVELKAPSLSQIENGGQSGVDTIERIAKVLGVSPGWLAYGVGPMVLPPRRRTRSAPATASP
jgi:transcriptional regulator with XRE-family HTH domain